MIVETAALTAITEFLRPHFMRIFMRRKNNRTEIQKMKRDMPTFETVGELKELLKAFSDDTPTMVHPCERPHIQIVDWIGQGRITFGKTTGGG